MIIYFLVFVVLLWCFMPTDFVCCWFEFVNMCQGLEGLNNLAHKCRQLKPTVHYNGLMSLLIGILEESPEARLSY